MAVFRSGQSGLLMPGVVRPTALGDIVVPDGLVRYWPFDVDCLKSSTVTTDLTGRSDGTVNGSVAFNATGQIGGCYSFPGGASTSNISSTVNAGFVKSTAMTISLWAKSTASSGAAALVGTQVDSGAFDGIFLSWGNNSVADKTQFTLVDSTGANLFAKRATVAKALNIWYHLVATYSGSNTAAGILLYENGENVATTTPFTTPLVTDPNDRPWRIGNDQNPGDSPFTGFIDDVRIYNRVLDASEVRAIYICGLQGSRDQAPLGLGFSGWSDDSIMQGSLPSPDLLMAQICM